MLCFYFIWFFFLLNCANWKEGVSRIPFYRRLKKKREREWKKDGPQYAYILHASFIKVTLEWWEEENKRVPLIYLSNKYLLCTKCIPGRETVVQKFIRQISDLEDLIFTGRKRENIRKGDLQFQHKANCCDGSKRGLGEW